MPTVSIPTVSMPTVSISTVSMSEVSISTAKPPSNAAAVVRLAALVHWRWPLRAALMVLASALLLLLPESGLHVTGFGCDTRLYKPVAGNDRIGSNAEFGARFFSRAIARTPLLSSFTPEKPDRTYRIFLLTDHDRYNMLSAILVMVRVAPFINQGNHHEILARIRAQMDALKGVSRNEDPGDVPATREAAGQRRPGDLLLGYNYAKLLVNLRQTARAERELDHIASLIPSGFEQDGQGR